MAVRRDQPQFHVSGEAGWLNDPNGPLHHNGVYHLFFQHLPTGCAWNWNLVWGHAVSRDLVTWHRLPPVLVPTPGGYDGDGCFSGCSVLDHDGTPVILYTGVRLKSSEGCVLPPHEFDLQLPFIETQCAAIPADLNDPFLTVWTKVEVPWLALPLPQRQLGGWRDPYVLDAAIMEADGMAGQRLCLMGSGVKESGGNVIVYHSTHLEVLHGWELMGEMCSGYGEHESTGFIWECPLLCALSPTLGGSATAAFAHAAAHTASTSTAARSSAAATDSPAAPGDCCGEAAAAAADALPCIASTSGPRPSHQHFLCISPDACTKPSLYWLGNYCRGKFDLASALGPFRLDLGDIVYAPNTLVDPQRRTLLWAWQQERRKVGSYNYAGCLSIPRILSIDRSGPCGTAQLVQTPAPEITLLRRPDNVWRCPATPGLTEAADWPRAPGEAAPLLACPACPLSIQDGWRMEVPQIDGHCFEVELSLLQGVATPPGAAPTPPTPAAIAASALAGSPPPADAMRLTPAGVSSGLLLRAWQSGSEGSAALVYHWDTGVLEVVFEALDPDTLQFSLTAPTALRVGGKLRRPPAPGQPLDLRLFVDYSLVEVFTSQGEALSTRVYRGEGPVGCAGVELVSFGGETLVAGASAYEMSPIWAPDEAPTAATAAAAAAAEAAAAEEADLLLDDIIAAATLAPAWLGAEGGWSVSEPGASGGMEPLALALAGALAYAPELADQLEPALMRALLGSQQKVHDWQQWQNLLSQAPTTAAVDDVLRHSPHGSRPASRRNSMGGGVVGVEDGGGMAGGPLAVAAC